MKSRRFIVFHAFKLKKRVVIPFVFALISFFVVNGLGIYTANPDTVETAGAPLDGNTRIPILLYHNIDENYTADSTMANISSAEFREHMESLISYGYDFISLPYYYECIKNGRVLPDRPIIITFDDGYSSNYEIAFPILKEMNIPATIFIVTSTVGEVPEGGLVNFPHFTWEEARIMEESGLIDIQSHTHTHQDMSTLTISEFNFELTESKRLIEENLNKECTMIAYPHGRNTNITTSIAKGFGYEVQLLVNSYDTNKVSTVSEGLEGIRRITVFGGTSGYDLLHMIEEEKRH